MAQKFVKENDSHLKNIWNSIIQKYNLLCLTFKKFVKSQMAFLNFSNGFLQFFHFFSSSFLSSTERFVYSKSTNSFYLGILMFLGFECSYGLLDVLIFKKLRFVYCTNFQKLSKIQFAFWVCFPVCVCLKYYYPFES